MPITIKDATAVIKVNFDTKTARRNIGKLRKIANPASMRPMLRRTAQKIIKTAKEAPIPEDTGDLKRSDFIEFDERDEGNMICRFGFRKIYATAQDLGMSGTKPSGGTYLVPQRSYGSEKGANLYFSETVERMTEDHTIMQQIVDEIRQKIAAALGGGKK